MMNIEILGTCACCAGKTEKLFQKQISKFGIEANIIYNKNLQDISAYGISKTPAVIINGTIIHEGGIPTEEKIKQWLIEFSGKRENALSISSKNEKGGYKNSTVDSS